MKKSILFAVLFVMVLASVAAVLESGWTRTTNPATARTALNVPGLTNNNVFAAGTSNRFDTLTGSNIWDKSNVRFWGAKGDGVTDDTSALRAMATNLNNAGGGTMFFPPGRYFVNVTELAYLLKFTSLTNVVIRGDNACLFNTNKYTIVSGDLTTMFLFESCTNVIVEGVDFIGLPLSSYTNPATTIGYHGATFIDLTKGTEGVRIRTKVSHARYGVHSGHYDFPETGGCKNITADVTGYYCGYPVVMMFADAADCTVYSEWNHRSVYYAGVKGGNIISRSKNFYIADIQVILTDARIATNLSRGCSSITVSSIDMGSTTWTPNTWMAGISPSRTDPEIVYSDIDFHFSVTSSDTIASTLGGFCVTSPWTNTTVLENITVSGIVDRRNQTVATHGVGEIYFMTEDVVPTNSPHVDNVTFRDVSILSGSGSNPRALYFFAPYLTNGFLFEGCNFSSYNILTDCTNTFLRPGSLTIPRINIGTSGSLQVTDSNGLAKVTILDSGNTGFGTTNPVARVDVQAPGDTAALLNLQTTQVNQDGWLEKLGPYVSVSSDNTGNWYTTWGTHYNGAANAWVRDYLGALPSMGFKISTDGDFFIISDPSTAAGVPAYSNIVTIENGGNFGIGTNDPGTKADIVGVVKATGYQIASAVIDSWDDVTNFFTQIGGGGGSGTVSNAAALTLGQVVVGQGNGGIATTDTVSLATLNVGTLNLTNRLNPNTLAPTNGIPTDGTYSLHMLGDTNVWSLDASGGSGGSATNAVVGIQTNGTAVLATGVTNVNFQATTSQTVTGGVANSTVTIGVPTSGIGDDTAYGAGWNANTGVATKNALYDKIESIVLTPSYTNANFYPSNSSGTNAVTIWGSGIRFSGPSTGFPVAGNSINSYENGLIQFVISGTQPLTISASGGMNIGRGGLSTIGRGVLEVSNTFYLGPTSGGIDGTNQMQVDTLAAARALSVGTNGNVFAAGNIQSLSLNTTGTAANGMDSLIITNTLNARTNIGSFDVITTDFVVGTRYTNSTRRSFVAASFQLSAAASGTAAVTLFVEQSGVTNKLTVSAGPLASLITVEPLMLPVGPGAFYYFTDLTSGVGGAATIVAGTSSRTDF